MAPVEDVHCNTVNFLVSLQMRYPGFRVFFFISQLKVRREMVKMSRKATTWKTSDASKHDFHSHAGIRAKI